MSKIYRLESQDYHRQRPIQNFPDYLRYVAKKSKAGFGKVHEELYRIYSESFSSTNKSVDKPDPQPCINQHVKPADNETAKSKRKRWSRRSALFWSSTGQEKPIGNSFVSYIPEEREDFLSSSSSKGDFDVLSDELDIIKHENHALHNNGICSASECDKDKSKFDFDGFCMPHIELTDELIYANDRVLREEKITTLGKKQENAEEDESEIYSVPSLNDKEQGYEIGDYVNLRALCKDIEDARWTIEGNSAENINDPDKQNSKHKNDRKTEKSKDDDDDDNYYLPPLNWTQSCCLPATNQSCGIHLYAKVAKKRISADDKPFSNISKDEVRNSNTLVRTSVKEGNDIETDDNDYVFPEWVDPDYENVPCKNKTTPLCKNIANKSSPVFTKGQDLEIQSVKSQCYTEGVEAVYDSPVERGQYVNYTEIDFTNNSDKESKDNRITNNNSDKYNRSENVVIESTEYLYTTGMRDNTGDSDDGEYSVPTATKLVTLKYNDSNENSSESEGDYSVPKWPKPLKVPKNSEHDLKQNIYASPTSGSETQLYSTIPTHNNNDKTESSDATLKSSGEKDAADFYNYTVDEVVECLNNCAFNKLAEICKEKQLSGDYFRSLTTDDLKGEPYHMNWFYISKLFKVISGWRPKRSFRK